MQPDPLHAGFWPKQPLRVMIFQVWPFPTLGGIPRRGGTSYLTNPGDKEHVFFEVYQ